jgi:hypothetical protein
MDDEDKDKAKDKAKDKTKGKAGAVSRAASAIKHVKPARSTTMPSEPRIQFDHTDQRVLDALDHDFEISDGNEVATVGGGMAVEATRLAEADGTRYQLQITFPGGFLLQVTIARIQLLEQLNIEVDDLKT